MRLGCGGDRHRVHIFQIAAPPPEGPPIPNADDVFGVAPAGDLRHDPAVFCGCSSTWESDRGREGPSGHPPPRRRRFLSQELSMANIFNGSSASFYPSKYRVSSRAFSTGF